MNKQFVKVVEISYTTLKAHSSYNEDTYKKSDGSVYLKLLFPTVPRHLENCRLYRCMDR